MIRTIVLATLLAIGGCAIKSIVSPPDTYGVDILTPDRLIPFPSDNPTYNLKDLPSSVHRKVSVEVCDAVEKTCDIYYCNSDRTPQDLNYSDKDYVIESNGWVVTIHTKDCWST